jgi:hypothetical protein
VVVISLDTWNSWQETEYLLSSPANARRLMESIARLDAGKGQVHALPDAYDETEHRNALGVAEPENEYRVHAKPARKPKPRTKRAKKPTQAKRR